MSRSPNLLYKTVRSSLQVLLIVLAISLFTACSGEIEGTVSVKGNMPHTYLALTTDDGKTYEITGKAAEKLRSDYQGSRVRLKGKLIREPDGPQRGLIQADQILE